MINSRLEYVNNIVNDGQNIYSGLAGKLNKPSDMHGWGHDDPNFANVISMTTPRLILEVGTWKGASAITMLNETRRFSIPDCGIVCVDTWLGATEFYTTHRDETRFGALKKVDGFPTVYHTFLNNVVNLGLESRVVPFPQTSRIAANVFGYFGFGTDKFFDCVYLDASHTYPDVMADIQDFLPMVRPGGILFGDDYSDKIAFPGVSNAVDKFTSMYGLDKTISKSGRQWMIHKGA